MTSAVLETPFDSSVTTTQVQHLGRKLSTRVDITLDDGGTLIVPRTVIVAGGQTILLAGEVVGLRNLIIDSSGSVTFKATGNTAGAPKGNYVIDRITLRRGGALTIEDVNITSTSITVGSNIAGET